MKDTFQKQRIKMSTGNHDGSTSVSSRTRSKTPATGRKDSGSWDLLVIPSKKKKPTKKTPKNACQQNIDHITNKEADEKKNKTLQPSAKTETITVISVEDTNTTSTANVNQPIPQASQIDNTKQEKKTRNSGTRGSLKRAQETCDTKSSSSRSKRRKNDQNMNKETADKEKDDRERDNECTICMENIKDRKTLEICKHSYCRCCIDEWFRKTNPICPVCGCLYGAVTGNQPKNGTMVTYTRSDFVLPGYENCGVIVIKYTFPDGIQTEEHPHPGERYDGTFRIAYLPNNQEGQQVCELLRKAFDARLTFTVGRSATTGLDNQITWNDIHHKTRPYGGIFSYPDETYLARVKLELSIKGIK